MYQCGDSRELAEKIRQALQNPEEAGRMARRGQLHALEYYSLERCTEQVLELYQRVVPGFCGRIQPETLQRKRAAVLWRSAAGTWTGSKHQISARNRQRILCPGDGESSSEGRAPGCFRGRDGGPGGGDMSYRSAIFS